MVLEFLGGGMSKKKYGFWRVRYRTSNTRSAVSLVDRCGQLLPGRHWYQMAGPSDSGSGGNRAPRGACFSLPITMAAIRKHPRRWYRWDCGADAGPSARINAERVCGRSWYTAAYIHVDHCRDSCWGASRSESRPAFGTTYLAALESKEMRNSAGPASSLQRGNSPNPVTRLSR